MTDDEQQYPSAIRAQIRDEHADLLELLDIVEQIAQRVHRGDAALEAALREACRVFVGRTEAVLALEQRILAPALRDVDAWGRLRAADLARVHAEEHALIRSVETETENPGVAAARFAADVIDVTARIREALGYEARHFLNGRLLRDELANPNMEAG